MTTDAPEVYDAHIRRNAQDFAVLAGTLTRHGAPWCIHGGFAVACYSPPSIYRPTLQIVLPLYDLAPVLLALHRQVIFTEAFYQPAMFRPARSQAVRFHCLERYQPFPARATMRSIYGEPVPVAAWPDVVQGLRWTLADPDRSIFERAKASLDLLRLTGL